MWLKLESFADESFKFKQSSQYGTHTCAPDIHVVSPYLVNTSIYYFFLPNLFFIDKKKTTAIFVTNYITGIKYTKFVDILDRFNIRQNSAIRSTWGTPSVDASFPGL